MTGWGGTAVAKYPRTPHSARLAIAHEGGKMAGLAVALRYIDRDIDAHLVNGANTLALALQLIRMKLVEETNTIINRIERLKEDI